jgi:glycosyltransferase involved in cell wall biosynthesis
MPKSLGKSSVDEQVCGGATTFGCSIHGKCTLEAVRWLFPVIRTGRLGQKQAIAATISSPLVAASCDTRGTVLSRGAGVPGWPVRGIRGDPAFGLFLPLMTDACSRAPRIAIIADVRGWAFDNIANNILSILKDYARVDIIYSAEISGHTLFQKVFLSKTYDHVHFLPREVYLSFFFDDEFANQILSALGQGLRCDRSCVIDQLADGMGGVTLTFGVYDHVHLETGDVRERRAALALADGYSVSSEKLSRIYLSAYGISPTVETRDGVDLEIFRPANPGRVPNGDRPLVVGWVGNSEWNKEAGNDPKGLETIVRPAIALLMDEGLQVVGDFADRKERWRQRHEMPEYYHGIDVLVCAATTEGTPNPVLEAMACGVPIISTDVGIVPEVLGEKQHEFIIPRDVSLLADAIRRLCLNRGLLVELSQENIRQIESRAWSGLYPNWCHLLRSSHRERIQGRGLARASLVLARCSILDLTIENAALKKQESNFKSVYDLLQITLDKQDARFQSIELSSRRIGNDLLEGQDCRLRSIEQSLQMILEVASWQRKMLRPVHWCWVRALSIRRLIARARRR